MVFDLLLPQVLSVLAAENKKTPAMQVSIKKLKYKSNVLSGKLVIVQTTKNQRKDFAFMSNSLAHAK